MKKFAIPFLLLLAACKPADQDQPWLGYGEGDAAYISAPQAGWVTQIKVERGTAVHRGDLLFVLDDTHEKAGQDQAQASLAQARDSLNQEIANLAYTNTTLERQNRLARDHAGTPPTSTSHSRTTASLRHASASSGRRFPKWKLRFPAPATPLPSGR
jgi:multidrug resistance efflux pump